jgi:hypothetical protein
MTANLYNLQGYPRNDYYSEPAPSEPAPQLQPRVFPDVYYYDESGNKVILIAGAVSSYSSVAPIGRARK